jgi:hypothetical protein
MDQVKVVTPAEMMKIASTLDEKTSIAYIQATSDLIKLSGKATYITVSAEDIHRHLQNFYNVTKPWNYSKYLDLIDAENSPFRAAGWKVKWVSGTGEREGTYNYFVFSV